MAKGLHVSFRRPQQRSWEGVAREICRRLTPDRTSIRAPLIRATDTALSCVFNPTHSIRLEGLSFALGVVQDEGDAVFRLGAPAPTGTYAIVRAGDDEVEVLSDFAATRTLWFAKTEDCFVVSTSQRMVAAFLGEVEVNEQTVRWMLATGTLGPGLAWDRRLRALPASSAVVLDRRRWTLARRDGAPAHFRPAQRSQRAHRRALEQALEQSIGGLAIDDRQWTLALSGGLDSRSLLFHLKQRANLQCVTWGLQSSLDRADSDAAVASGLAEACGLEHSYATTDLEANSFPTALGRFVRAGEGRIDNLAGYMDGLNLWSRLAEAGRSIIRGYDALGGTIPTFSAFQARYSASLVVSRDLTHSLLPKDLEVEACEIPEELQKENGESLAAWRDRLWLSFRTPAITAALDEIKVSYVEIVNPLLFQPIVEVVQSLPDRLRTNKRLFRRIVADMFPGVPLARRYSVPAVEEILSKRSIRSYLRDSLLDLRATSVLPPDVLTQLAEGAGDHIVALSRRRMLLDVYRTHAPLVVRTMLRRLRRGVPVDPRRMALRALLVERSVSMLREDARLRSGAGTESRALGVRVDRHATQGGSPDSTARNSATARSTTAGQA